MTPSQRQSLCLRREEAVRGLGRKAWSWWDHTGIQDPSAPQAGKLGLLALWRAEEPSPAGPDACLACLTPTGFAVGWGPIPWLLMSEIFPLHVKGVATGICVLTNWLMAFLVTKEFSSLMVSAGSPGTPFVQSAEQHFLKPLVLQKTRGRGPYRQPGPHHAWATGYLGQGEVEADGLGQMGNPGCDPSGVLRLSWQSDSTAGLSPS